MVMCDWSFFFLFVCFFEWLIEVASQFMGRLGWSLMSARRGSENEENSCACQQLETESEIQEAAQMGASPEEEVT